MKNCEDVVYESHQDAALSPVLPVCRHYGSGNPHSRGLVERVGTLVVDSVVSAGPDIQFGQSGSLSDRRIAATGHIVE
jgi:hypothetical protein